MTRNVMGIMTLMLGVATSVHADCVLDSVEIGDAGPGSSMVCKMLETRFPNTRLEVLNREIHSPDHVSVIVSVDERRRTLDYRLVGAEWVLPTPQLAHTR